RRCAFASRRGTFVADLMLAGRSILVVEEQPFVAHCLRIFLEGAGAELHCAASATEALRVIDRSVLSAAVLDDSSSARGHRRVTQQLARCGLPFVVCTAADHDQPWPGASVLIKPVMGLHLVETLYRLIRAQDAKMGTSGATPVHEPPPSNSESRTKFAVPKEIL